MTRFLRSLVFAIGQWFSILLYWPVSVTARLFESGLRTRLISGWAWFIVWWLKLICGLDHRVRGAGNLVAGPAVFLCKHQSAWETIALQTILPRHTWVLKRELLWIPFFGWGLAASKPIAIDRSRGSRALDQLLKQGTERLAEGTSIVVFPEGTRMPPGVNGRHNVGGAMLATRTATPVIPIAHDAGHFWPKRGFLKKSGTITVVIGEPIDTSGMKPRDVNEMSERWINATMAELERNRAGDDSAAGARAK